MTCIVHLFHARGPTYFSWPRTLLSWPRICLSSMVYCRLADLAVSALVYQIRSPDVWSRFVSPFRTHCIFQVLSNVLYAFFQELNVQRSLLNVTLAYKAYLKVKCPSYLFQINWGMKVFRSSKDTARILPLLLVLVLSGPHWIAS